MCYNHVVDHLTKSRISELIKRNNTSIEEVAKRIEASPELLRAIEDGRYDPPLSVAHKLAAAFDVPVEKLFDDKDGEYYDC